MAQIYLGNNIIVDGSTHSDQVIAAAFNDLESRVETLEEGGGGSTFDPTEINSSISDISTRVSSVNSSVSDISTRIQTIESNYLDSNDISTFVSLTDVSNFTYNKAHIDASFAAIPMFDPTDINSSLDDISTRVSTIESDYLDSDDISTFVDIDDVSGYVENFTYNKAHIDASFSAIPMFDPTDINSSIGDISTRVNTIESNYLDSDDISTFVSLTDVSNFTYNKAHIDASINAITPNFVVMSEADYELITPNPSTLYFLT